MFCAEQCNEPSLSDGRVHERSSRRVSSVSCPGSNRRVIQRRSVTGDLALIMDLISTLILTLNGNVVTGGDILEKVQSEDSITASH